MASSIIARFYARSLQNTQTCASASCLVQLTGPHTHCGVGQRRNKGTTNMRYQFRRMRAQKVLPGYEQMVKQLKKEMEFRKLSEEDARGEGEKARLFKKQMRLADQRVYQKDRPIIDTSYTGQIAEAYQPPASSDKWSLLSKSTKVRTPRDVARDRATLRIIKKYIPLFSKAKFPMEAQEIYIEAHDLLNEHRDKEDELLDCVTPNVYLLMTTGMERKTFRWKFIESVEPPKVVQCRLAHLMSREDHYAQVTVRFHTRQTLAIYDRFGRLISGGPDLVKNVLEYVVFENFLINEFGHWRICGKIPAARHERPSLDYHQTYMEEEEQEEEEEAPELHKDVDKKGMLY